MRPGSVLVTICILARISTAVSSVFAQSATEQVPRPGANNTEPAADAPLAPPRTADLVVMAAGTHAVGACHEVAADLLTPGLSRMPSAHERALCDSSGSMLSSEPAGDADMLHRLAEHFGAAAAVVVQLSAATPGQSVVWVFDVGRNEFFEGQVELPREASVLGPFVLSRVGAAMRAQLRRGDDPGETVPPETNAVQGPTSEPAQSATLDGAESASARPAQATTPPEGPDIFEQALPYVVVGALLVAAVVFVTIRSSENNEPQPSITVTPAPLLRF